MRKPNIFKSIKLFFIYKKILREIRSDLDIKFNIRIDRAKRLYTVINIPEETFEEVYAIRKADIDKISEKFIKDYSSNLDVFLQRHNIKELCKPYELKKVGKYSYLLVYGFSLFRSQYYYNVMYYFLTPAIILALIVSYFVLI